MRSKSSQHISPCAASMPGLRWHIGHSRKSNQHMAKVYSHGEGLSTHLNVCYLHFSRYEMCFWGTVLVYLFDCKLRLEVFFQQFVRLTIKTRAAYIFYFFTLSKGIDDAQSFLCYVFSNKCFFHIHFSSASHAHPTQELWWTEGSCSGASIITRLGHSISNWMGGVTQCFRISMFSFFLLRFENDDQRKNKFFDISYGSQVLACWNFHHLV